MLTTLLCKLNLGHHWVAEADRDGNFNRHCRNCGKEDRRGGRWSERLSARDRPLHIEPPDPGPGHF